MKSIRDMLPTTFPVLQWVCHLQCYGKDQPFGDICSACLNKYMKGTTNAVLVVGSGIHVYEHFNRTFAPFAAQFDEFFSKAQRLIFVTAPHYLPTRNYTERNEALYDRFLPILQKYEQSRRLRALDFHQLTKSCRMENCSIDGGHRSRFVNRWKAQLLLNTICTASSTKKPSHPYS